VVTNNYKVRYFAVFCITSGTYTVIGLIISWCESFRKEVVYRFFPLIFSPLLVSHNLGSESKRATGTPLYMAIGQCGSVLGAHLYPATEGPRYM
jgi:hypothetical protein